MANHDMARREGIEVAGTGLEFTDEQRRMIRDTFANGASDAEFEVLMEIARARRLNPLFRQIHFVSRWDSEKHRPVWAAQVSIDGLRAIAERTGLYQGQDEPDFVENPDGTLKLCRVRVYRRDWPRPAVGMAYWSEYVQTIRDKATGKTRPAAMWARMPHVMLAKCAESLALRKAFPEDMAGLYTGEEMSQSHGDLSINAAAARGSVARVLPPAPARLPSPEESFSMRVAAIRKPEEAVSVWIDRRDALALAGSAVRNAAWRSLGDRIEALGQKDGRAWLKHAVAEEDARRDGDLEALPTGAPSTGALPDAHTAAVEASSGAPKEADAAGVPDEVLKAAKALARKGPAPPPDPWLDFLG